MTKRDPVKTLRDLMVAEIRADNPSFNILRNLQSALQSALQRQNRLSVDDAEEGGFVGNVTIGGGQGVVLQGAQIYGDNEMEQDEGGRARRRRFKESQRDQMLSMMDQVIARTGSDPLVAVVQAIPHMDVLYPNGIDRERVVARIRQEIEGRLGAASEGNNPVEEREEKAS